jgi:choline dehydrogenase-like flavoprotein
MIEIKGRIQNLKNEPLSGILVSAYDRWDIGGDHPVDPSPTKTTLDGSFKIIYNLTNPMHLAHIFLVINDSRRQFRRIRYGQSEFDRDTTSDTWRSKLIDQNELGNISITVNLKKPVIMPDKYGAVVIGSGFGGTITSRALARKFEDENKQKEEKLKQRVCILERGQWWVSHEMPDSPEGTLDGKPTIRSYLNENDIPYGLWAYPNNNKGLLHILGNVRSRPINSIRGLYEYTALQNNSVNVITSSGVGGGSLVYFNITERPDDSVLDRWESELGLDINSKKMKPYYDKAEKFIGVNSIPTNAGLGRFRLPRSKVFHDATNQIHKTNPNHLVTNSDGSLPDLDARLSITDVPNGLFGNGHPTEDEITRYSTQTNICQRQGRCGIGCIPGARHSLNKQIHDLIIKEHLPVDVHPLCEVIDIGETGEQEYKYYVKFIDYRSVIDDPKINSFKDVSDEKKKELTKTIKTNLVILSAGSLGSTQLLLKSKSLKLSKTLGSSFSTNGDMFGIINPTLKIVDASRGPTQTSIARFKNPTNGMFAFSIEDVGIPKIFAGVFTNIANTMRSERGSIKGEPYRPKSNVQKLFRQNILDGIAMNINNPQLVEALFRMIESTDLSSLLNWIDRLMKLGDFLRLISHDSQSPEELVYDKLVLFGVGLDEGKGRLVPKADGDGIDLKDHSLEQQIFKDIIQGMNLYAKEIGKSGEDSLVIPAWDTQNKTQIVAHPLGGCIMGKDSSKGVVNSMGKVYRVDNSGMNNSSSPSYYDGLYVVDGSIVPSALGVNPSMTITSLALRIAEEELTKLKL